MTRYVVKRTDVADSLIHRIILGIAEEHGPDVAMEKMDELERKIMLLGEEPYLGINPRYRILKKQGYKVLITEKSLVFYKINELNKVVTVSVVVEKKEDYLNTIRGL